MPHIQTEQPLPAFRATTWKGEPVEAEALRGHPLWIGLYRYASCPLCNLRIHEIIERWPGWEERGLRKLAVFQSDAASMARYVGRQEPPFTLVADPDERLYKLFGAGASWSGFVHPGNAPRLAAAAADGFFPGKMEGTKSRLPMDILVDRDGIVRDIFRAKKIGDHIPFERIDRFLDRWS